MFIVHVFINSFGPSLPLPPENREVLFFFSLKLAEKVKILKHFASYTMQAQYKERFTPIITERSSDLLGVFEESRYDCVVFPSHSHECTDIGA